MMEPRTDNRGQLIPNSLRGLDDPSLETWLQAHLKGENLSITGDVYSYGRPSYLITEIFNEIDSDTRERIRQIILKSLKQVRDGEGKWSDEAVMELLLLVETYFPKTQYRDTVIGLLKQLYERWVKEGNLELQRRVLQELLGLEYQASDPDFWYKVANSEDLFGLALYGLWLQKRGWAKVLEFLPSMPNSELAFSQVISTLNFILERSPEPKLEAKRLKQSRLKQLRELAFRSNKKWVKDVINHVLDLHGLKGLTSVEEKIQAFPAIGALSKKRRKGIMEFLSAQKKEPRPLRIGNN